MKTILTNKFKIGEHVLCKINKGAVVVKMPYSMSKSKSYEATVIGKSFDEDQYVIKLNDAKVPVYNSFLINDWGCSDYRIPKKYKLKYGILVNKNAINEIGITPCDDCIKYIADMVIRTKRASVNCETVTFSGNKKTKRC